MASNVLQHAKIDPAFSLGDNLHTAMTRHGKSPWSQVRDIWRLRYGPGTLRTAMARRTITEAQGT